MRNVNVVVTNRPPTVADTTSTRMGVKANQSLKLIFLQGKADVSVIYNDREITQPILGKDIDTEFDLLNQSVQGTPKEITYISVCNINATIAKVNVVIEDGTNTHYILKDIQIKQGETLEYYDTLGWSIKSNASMHTQFPIGVADMEKVVYDTDDDGIVDNSMALDGHPASDFMLAGSVSVPRVVSSVTLGENVGGGGVIYLDSSGLGFKYNKNDLSLYGKCFGVTNQSGVTGDVIDVVTSGECNQMGGLILGSIYYADLNGLVTPTAPTVDIFQPIGIAKNATTIIVNIEKPYIKI